MDLDGDGHDDVISGQYSPGIINLWRGSETGFDEKTKLAERTTEQPGFERDMKTWMATANFADWDGDGDYDMIVGNVRGGVMININEGTEKKPQFGVRRPLEVAGKDMKVAGKSDPMAVDWDGDGRLDILAGTEAGDVFFFHRLADGTFAAPVSALTGKSRPDVSYRTVKNQLKDEGVDLGYRLRIEVVDWNRDGLLDLLVGNCFRGPNKKTTGNVFVFLRKGKAALPVAKRKIAK